MTLTERLQVFDVRTDEGRILASARVGPYGWYVSLAGPHEIYVATKADAEACLAGVREALR